MATRAGPGRRDRPGPLAGAGRAARHLAAVRRVGRGRAGLGWRIRRLGCVRADAFDRLTRRFAALGGVAELRRRADGNLLLTDNGHPLLDVHGLRIDDPLALEIEVNQWPGVVTVGVFARHRAHTCLLGTVRGVRKLVF